MPSNSREEILQRITAASKGRLVSIEIPEYESSDIYKPIDLTCVILFKKQIVGIIGLKDTDLHNQKTEIGYWLSELFQHKGIVTKSCKVLINRLFAQLCFTMPSCHKQWLPNYWMKVFM